MNHDYFRCFSCSERPCDPDNCNCPCHSDPPVMNAKNDRTILSWLLLLMISLLGLQIVEVLIDLAQLWLG